MIFVSKIELKVPLLLKTVNTVVFEKDLGGSRFKLIFIDFMKWTIL